jgi:hypothetical protein
LTTYYIYNLVFNIERIMFIQKWILKNILGKNKSLDNPKILSDAMFIESKKENEGLTIIKYEKLSDLASIVVADYINSNKVQNSNKIINDVPQTKELTMTDDEILVNNLCTNINPEDFEHIKVLGKGFFGKVTQVKYKKNGNIYAMKTLRKEKLKQAKQIEHTKTEKKVLEIVDHPFIVSLKYAFQTPKKLYLIMEYYSGGELFYLLKHCGRFNEKEAKFYFAQIVLVMEFLHSKKIVYR